jgi:hypothetical protein
VFFNVGFQLLDCRPRQVVESTMRNAQKLLRKARQFERAENVGQLGRGYADALAKKARAHRATAYRTLGIDAPEWA